MKRHTILFLLIPSLFIREPATCKSSINADKLFIGKLNIYRSYYNVKPLIWNDTIYNMALHHSDYMEKSNSISHFEDKPIPDFNLINSLHDRAKYFGIRIPVAENVIGGFTTIILNKSTPFSEFVKLIWKINIIDTTPEERSIYYCIYDWHLSKNGHKEIMLSDKFTMGAVSLKYSNSIINQLDQFFDGAVTQEIRVLAVFNVCG